MVVHHDAAHVMLIEEGIAHVVRSSGYAEIGFEEMLLARKFPIHEIPHLQALAEQRKPITISNTRDSAEWTNLPEVSWIRSYAGAPIRIKEKTVGFLGVDSGTPGFFTERDAFRLQVFADQAAIALENARLYAHIQYLAMTDELTGLLNRRGLREKGEKEIARCRRYKRPLSAVLIDIDDFKRVNDRYGHAVGDQAIQFVAQNIKNQIRDVDLAARIGGDEMFVLLPETTVEQAQALAERIRLSIGNRPLIAENVDVFITLSLGVCRMAAEKDDFSSILVKLDRALYKAKQAGRNSVMLHEE